MSEIYLKIKTARQIGIINQAHNKNFASMCNKLKKIKNETDFYDKYFFLTFGVVKLEHSKNKLKEPSLDAYVSRKEDDDEKF